MILAKVGFWKSPLTSPDIPGAMHGRDAKLFFVDDCGAYARLAARQGLFVERLR